jgi:RNA polymerase sigma-70 factor, ECF subfamily
MSSVPQTQASLIARIASAEDAQAWDEFLRLYQPVVYRLACRQGCQHADAEELVQEVMLAIARNVENWDPDPSRGRFRHWLFRIARNQIINHLSRRKNRTWRTGQPETQALLEQVADPVGALSSLLEIEYRRSLFQHAARLVQTVVKPRTWNAFWLSAVENVPMQDVAQRLEMSVGSVYIARTRVVARLREEVRRIEREESGTLDD